MTTVETFSVFTFDSARRVRRPKPRKERTKTCHRMSQSILLLMTSVQLCYLASRCPIHESKSFLLFGDSTLVIQPGQSGDNSDASKMSMACPQHTLNQHTPRVGAAHPFDKNAS